jgi:hypothetical protein
MNEKIMIWSSDAMYKGELKAHESVAKRLMSDFYESKVQDDILSCPITIIDTAGALMYEDIDEKS